MNRAELARELRKVAAKRSASPGVFIADASGIPVTSVRRVLRGDNAKLETIEAVANALGLELSLVPVGRRG